MNNRDILNSIDRNIAQIGLDLREQYKDIQRNINIVQEQQAVLNQNLELLFNKLRQLSTEIKKNSQE